MANERWLADARQLLIEIERIYFDHYSRSYDQCVHDIFNAMRRVVRRNAAFGFVEVVHGHWISLTDCSNAGVYCSVCHKKVWKEDYAWCNRKNRLRSNYCPNCGAKMDGDGNA